MTTPQPPEGGAPPDPATPQPPERSSSSEGGSRDWESELRTALSGLDAERKARIKADAEITKLRRSNMNEAEQAIEAARTEGRTEASKSIGKRLAAAEFRARAAGKIADPSVLIEAMDMSVFVGDDGEPDTKKIDAVVERLVAAMPTNGKAPHAPSVPAGPRADPADGDWLRSAIAGGN